MGAGAVALAALRVFVVIEALAIVGLGAWAKVLVHDIEIRGSVVLDTLNLQQDLRDAWQAFFTTAVNSQLNIWIAIAAGSFTTLSTAFILTSQTSQRMKISAYLILPLELLALLATAASFGATLSLTMKLTGLSMGPPALDASPSPDLSSFAMLIPLSKGYAITAGTTLFTLLVTSLSALIQACHRARDSKACSFEPTASALGMGHGYQAVVPRKSRGPIPTLYDPLKPMPHAEQPHDEEKGFAAAGADMGRRDSGQAEHAGERESWGISGPLGLEAPAKVAQMRPARPWSEMPKRK